MRTPLSQSDFALMTSQNTTEKSANNDANEQNQTTLYQKCLFCPDYGISCNGPKLAALGDIMDVRAFHRAIRDRRGIPMKLIYFAANPVAESTINDYFSHSVKDFKWTTVGAIDNALTAICGNRVGKPLLDHPCPASSTEIQEQMEESAQKLRASEEACARLEAELENANQKRREQRTEIKAEDQKKIDHLKEQVDYLEERCEYLKETAEKRYKLIVNRDWIIIVLAAVSVAMLILNVIYMVWDYLHVGSGIFW